MSWRERDYNSDEDPMRPGGGLGGPGGDWQGLRPSFENPLSWSFSIGRLARINIRVHFIFILLVIVVLLQAWFRAHDRAQLVPLDFWLAGLMLACLFVIVLAHEFGHALACRWKGGEAHEILMWPLGGLAYCRPRPRWQDHMITVLGGPLVNVLICLVAGGFLAALTGRFFGVALPNPLNLFGGLYIEQVSRSWLVMTLYIVNAVSFLLLLFNLLPVFPLDGGRIVQAALWPRMGYAGSMRFAVRMGIVGAVLLLILGVVFGRYWIAAIAIFGVITCWLTHRQLTFMQEMAGVESDEYALSLAYGEDDDAETQPAKPTWRERRAHRQAEREREEAKEVDRILEKIAEHGMKSLSRRERHLLERVSERKRQQR